LEEALDLSSDITELCGKIWYSQTGHR
jgi:hypothetical protein